MPIARDLLSLLASAENMAALDALLERTVKRILEELATGVSRPGGARAAETIRNIRAIAREIDPRLDSKLRSWIREELPKAFILGDANAVADVKRALEEAGTEAIPGQRAGVIEGWTALNQTALRAMMASMTDRFNDIQRQILTQAGYIVRRTQLAFTTDAAIRQQVTDGIIRGATGREISNDIARAILKGIVPPDARARLQQAGLAGDIELYKQLGANSDFMLQVGGWRGTVRSYANLVSRTMQREAASVATVARLQQNGINHVQVSDKLPLKPDVCSLIAGKVYYIGPGEDPAGFPSLKEIPGGVFPPHPHCTHVLRPYVVALKSPVAVQSALDDANLVPDHFFGTDPKKAMQLVGSLDAAALQRLNPRLYGAPPEPPAKGRAA
jgi:hypothetical protein